MTKNPLLIYPFLLTLLSAGCGGGTLSTTNADIAVPSNGHNALVLVSPEAKGVNCQFGGQKIETGLDVDDNGILDQKEVTNTNYVCNGSNGVAVHDPLIFTSTEPAGNGVCNNLGGIKLETTIDFDDDLDANDSTLNVQELANLNTTYVCNSAAHSALVEAVTEFQGQNCPFGGKKIFYGQDINGNSTLEPSEVTGTIYVCSVLI